MSITLEDRVDQLAALLVSTNAMIIVELQYGLHFNFFWDRDSHVLS